MACGGFVFGVPGFFAALGGHLSCLLPACRFVNLITERKQKMVSIPLRQLAREVNV